MKEDRKTAAPKAEQKETVVVLGQEGSPYSSKLDGKELLCLYNGNVLCTGNGTAAKDALNSCERWRGVVRREFAIAVSNALVARNLHKNLVYTIPANEGIIEDRLVCGTLVGTSFGGQLFELSASVTFDAEALEGEDPLSVIRENCEIASRSLVDTIMTSRLQA